METPLLSVCIITYNHEAYIRQALDSVLEQNITFSWEIIIADDYSSDNTREILHEYQRKYPGLIKLILQEKNIGPARNWIDLLNAPKGKYIAYFDGDDYWTNPDKLQIQVNFLENNPEFSSCFHDTKVWDNEKEIFIYPEYTNDTYTVKDLLGNTALFHTSSFIFRRMALILPQWIPEIRSGDMVLFVIIAKWGPVKYIPGKMSVYRRHPKGVSNVTRQDALAVNENHILRLNYLDAFLDHKYSKTIDTTIKKYKKEIFYFSPLGKIVSFIRLRTRLKKLFGLSK
ncbi:MAG: epsE 1 [Bacteroidetes bacterium]|jgi:glycosyltransferase involved in cell wall biosynthesis|nr:epsE 1 [Bacteroidota bacterium]